MLLKIENVSVTLKGSGILKNVNLSIANGENVAILGPNGAGKTTLLRTISGLYDYKGQIFFKGENLKGCSPCKIAKLGIAHIPEGNRLFRQLSVRKNLIMGAYLIKNRDEIEDSMRMVFNLFPILKERRNQPAETLSGGLQKMLAIGRGLMARPNLLLADELSSGLAPKVLKDIKTSMEKIVKEYKIQLLLVEQNPIVAFGLSDNVYLMREGVLIKKVNEKEILGEYFK